ncbi:MAG: asparagine synthase (glutamine-hydrolyzing), partial [Rickettsiales bacterium]|nr:asparagine synthase (glutamine-hydrolyzing) [Rickettsiales bacterium]
IDKKIFYKILSMLDHRGPDEKKIKSLNNVQFGNTRLSIIGLNTPKSSLPISDESFLLAYNGEIYNYKQLNDLLKKNNIKVEGRSDSETLFLLLKNFGIRKTLSLLDGMYAFCFYDKKNKKLYMARDKIGERFLYWGMNKNKLLFSSEIKTIAKSGLIDASPNLEDLKDYLITSKIHGYKTFFKGIFEIEPGNFLTFDLEEKKYDTENFWKIENTFVNKDLKGIEGTLYKKLNQATTSRNISDVPLCILYSGGIDSNALVDLSCNINKNKNLELFFADNYLASFSEIENVINGHKYLSEKYKKNNLILNTNKVTLDKYLEEIESLAWYYDEPIAFANSVLLDQLCSIMKNKGLKVSISGEGSDEIFFGYDKFVRTHYDFSKYKNNLENISIDKKIGLLYYGGGLHSLNTVNELTNYNNISNEKDSIAWNWLKKNVNRNFDDLQLMYSQKFRLQLLLQRQDRVGMKNSIEIRTPYLAPELVAYVNSIPIAEKYNKHTNTTKFILKKIFKNKIDDKIVHQEKTGFPSDMLSWISENRMKTNIIELLTSNNSFSQNYLNGKSIKSILSSHYEGQHNFSTLVWMLYALEIWHKQFF